MQTMQTFHMASNGNTAIIDKLGGGYMLLKVSGSFGGGTVQPEVDFGDNSFQPLILNNELQNITIPGVAFIMPLKAGARLRFNLNGATSPDITIKVL